MSPGRSGVAAPTSTWRCCGPCGPTTPRSSPASSTPSSRARCSRSRSSPRSPIHIGGESDAALGRVARAGHGWHSFNRAPGDLAAPLARLDELLAGVGRSRSDITVTVCPYFQPLDAESTARYAEAGADAVAALVVPLDADSARSQLDALVAVQERASSF